MEGNVKEFGLADVIQFISTSQKTGVLLLDHHTDTASIAFARGDITAAVYGRQGKQDQLQDYLFRSKKLDPETIQKLAQIQKDTNLGIDEVMIKEQIMTEEELFGVIAFKIQEVIDDIFTWSDAHYKFDAQADLYSKSRTKVTIPPATLLIETMRRKDEWPRIKMAIPSEDIVLLIKPDGILPYDALPEAKQMMEFIDGNRTISEMIQLSGFGRFRTFNALFNLFELGMIERKVTESAALPPKPKAPSPVLKFIGPAATVMATAGIVLILLTASLFWGYKVSLLLDSKTNLVEELLLKSAQSKYRQEVEIYKMINGRYPAELKQVVKDRRYVDLLVYEVSGDGQSFDLKIVERK
ncbi:DUF4388 domain-containing protein [candidate division TA06 bacterium]|uniref:DUF4388 domain-containing protein n=1 Tax=candidate division TA06 bacterium TaxID=2250710 RepID=A0A933MJ60_UNCT6|nr:DUF4388 domain-containing protein [candidate division TA06 bacterium]